MVSLSIKEIRDKQNHAFQPLAGALVALIMLIIKAYGLFFKGAPFEWQEWAVWLFLFPTMLLLWRHRENKLKKSLAKDETSISDKYTNRE